MAHETERSIIEKALEDRDQTELYFGTSKQMSVRAFEKEIAAFSVAETAGVSARVIQENRTGAAYSERVTGDEVSSIIGMAEQNSAYPEADDGNVLFTTPSVESFDARKANFDDVAIERKRKLALELESASLARDSRIVNVPYAFYGESTGASILGNSYGVMQSYVYGYCYAYAYVMATEGDATEVGGHIMAAASFDEIDAVEIVSTAVEKALARLDSSEPESGVYTIVFDESAASDLIGAFVSGPSSPFLGENIQKGRSKLEDKLDARIGSDLFTIVDDPMTGIAPRPFDDEGLKTSTITIVDAGFFRAVIHNLYSATRGGASSTGHGSRGGYRGGISTSLHNPYVPNGPMTQDELIHDTGKGILVTDVEGLHAGLNPISGDFSLSAKGFLIEGGERTRALKNMVVAGNFYELASNLSGTANDRKMNTHKSFSSPAIRIDELSVSSN